MWRRFKRMVQSNLGRLSDLGGGRGLTADLEREARELERALKKAGEGLITVKGEVTFLEEKARKLELREQELVALEEAAVARGAEAAAGSYALELARVRLERAQTDRQLAVAREALERGQIARAALQAQRDQKLAEAREREKALLELEREDLGAAPAIAAPDLVEAPPPPAADAAPAADRPRKTVGGPAPELKPPPPPSLARSIKTIGPEPEPAPPPAPPPAAAPAAAIKVKVRARTGDATPAADRPAEPTDAGAAAEPTPAADLVGELERLVRLRDQGVLTDEELERAKRRLLGPEAGA